MANSIWKDKWCFLKWSRFWWSFGWFLTCFFFFDQFFAEAELSKFWLEDSGRCYLLLVIFHVYYVVFVSIPMNDGNLKVPPQCDPPRKFRPCWGVINHHHPFIVSMKIFWFLLGWLLVHFASNMSGPKVKSDSPVASAGRRLAEYKDRYT